MQPEQQQRIMGYFIEEAKDHLNTIEQGLLHLQNTIEDPEMVNELFRAAHSVKGGAAMLGLNSIQQVSHRMEDYFKILKESPVAIDQKLESLFLKVFDALQELLEQLQGPFGLTSDSANATLAGVEPTFVELEQHLNSLAGSAPAPLEATATNGLATAQPSEQEVLPQVFGSEVSVQLREMLQLFKRPESDQLSREQLQTICRNLTSLGEQFSLPAWCNLVEMARQAIACTDNPYRALAPVVIKDIKQAQDLVLAGRANEITACDQLQDLVPVQPTDVDFADLLATANGIDLMAELLVEDTEEDLLFANLETDPSPVELSTVDAGISGLDFDLSDSFGEDVAADQQRHGPEVGMAELNSLADLFEGEVPDLASTWQEEEVVGDASDVFSTDVGATTDDFDTAADFSDLLFDDTSSNQSASSGEDDLSDLFGDALLDDDTASVADEDNLFDLADDRSSGDDLDDLLAIATDDHSTNTFPDQEISLGDIDIAAEIDDLSFSEATTDLNADATVDDGIFMVDPDMETTSPLDNLGELFEGMDDADFTLTNSVDSLEESLFAAASEPVAAPLDTITASEGMVDDLSFGDTPATAEMADAWSSDDQSLLFDGSDESTMPDEFSDLLQENINESNDSADLELLLTDDFSEAGGATEADLGDLFDQDSLFAGQDNLGQDTSTNGIEALTDEGDFDFGSMFDSSEAANTSDTTSELGIEELPPITPIEDDAWLTDVMSENTFITPTDSDLFDLDTALASPPKSFSFEDSSQDEVGSDGLFDAADLFDSNDVGMETMPVPEALTSDDLDLLVDSDGLTTTETNHEDLELDGAVIFDAPLDAVAASDEFGFDAGELDLGQVEGTDEFGFDPDELDLDQIEGSTTAYDSGFDLNDSDLMDSIATSESLFDDADLTDFNLANAAGEQASDDPFADDLASLMGTGSPQNNDIQSVPDFELPDELLSEDLLSEDLLNGEQVDLDSMAGMDLVDATGTPDETGILLDFGDISDDEPYSEATEPFNLNDDLLTLDDGSGAIATEASLDLGDDLLGLGDLTEETTSQASDESVDALFTSDDHLFDTNGLDDDIASPSDLDLVDLAAVEPIEISASDDSDLSFDEDLSFDDLLDVPSSPAPNNFDDLDGFLETVPDVTTTEHEGGDFDALMEDNSSLTVADDLLDLDSLMSEEADASVTDNQADLNDLLGEDTTTTNDFGELDDLLSESSASGSGDFADLDNLLSDDSSTGDAFADLENLLDDTATNEPSLAAASAAATDDFADLEALLQSDELSLSASPAPIADRDTSFDDLNEMLKAAQDGPGAPASTSLRRSAPLPGRPSRKPGFEQTMRVPVKHLDNLSNLVGELVVNRNSLEQDQERLRQSLDNLLYQVQQLSDVGQRMQDLYERSLLESSLLASRQSHHRHHSPLHGKGDGATQTASSPTGVEYDPLEMDRFTGFHSLSQEMIELIVRVRESASDIEFIVDETDQVTRMFRQVTTQLQEGLTRSRMVPFAQTADRLPRAVRDIAIKVGKQAELVIEGRETLIDKMILEQLYDPMTHLVNNAITHGIESPEIRRSLGKAPTGRILIRAFHQGNQTIISVSDDGAGIDVERVKTKAIEKGLITPSEARSMSRLDMYDLLFHPGFSTKDQADDFSGRGVGMDVVRTSLSEIRGVINTDSTQGKGTSFTIRLPLTLSISKALCCISDRARIAFPMDGVEDMLDVPKDRIQTNPEGQPCLPWRDSLLPLRPLSELLGYNRHLSRGTVYGGNQEDDIASIVVLRSAGNFLALQVDQVLGEQEIVIKQLEGPVPKPIGVAGATVLGDGRIMPIADVLELIDLAMGRIRKDTGGSLWDQGATAIPQEPAVVKTEPMVLIVDDSITVRELLSMTFNKVGYRVEQARDGQEAWEKLRSGLPCDIVFCDIEMPRMDGLELLSRIQKDPNLTDLPIAMLTSRGADRHRQMASSLGASGYFTKPYLEEALLDAAQRMLKGEKLL